MNNSNYDIEKMNLTQFFTSHKKYRIFNYKTKNNKHISASYFYKTESSNCNIVILDNEYNGNMKDFDFENEVLKKLQKNLIKNHKVTKFKILVILLNYGYADEIIKDNHDILACQDNWIEQISKFFPSLKIYMSNTDIDLEKTNISEVQANINDKSSPMYAKFRNLNNRLRGSNLTIVWFMLVLFVILPLIFYFFSGSLFKSSTDDANVFSLAFGALNRDFLVGMNQWWRLWTYPIINNNFITIIIYGIMIYSVFKYSEVLMPKWTFLITFFVGVPLSGFIIAIAMPSSFFFGADLFAVVGYGALFIYMYKRTDLTSYLARIRTSWIPIFLVILPLFTGNFANYLVLFTGFCVGTALGFLYIYNWQSVDYTLGYPIIILLSVLIIPIVLIQLNTYLPPNNNDVISTLQFYYKNGLISKSYFEKILTSYYHIPNPNNYL